MKRKRNSGVRQGSWFYRLYKSAVIVIAVLLAVLIVSCENSVNHAFETTYSVRITAIDSVTSDPLYGVQVVEIHDIYTYDQILVGDSIQQGYDKYLNQVYTTHKYGTSFTYRPAGPPQPNYNQFAAYKKGYKIWKWSKDRDTIFHPATTRDSLCIRMVSK